LESDQEFPLPFVRLKILERIAMADVLWYYARNDQQFGPVSAAELKQLVDAGRLSPDDLLWREGMDAWTTAINLRGLFTGDQMSSATKLGIGGAPGIDPRTAANVGPPTSNLAASLTAVLRATQVMLWGVCVLVVLVGILLFTQAFLAAKKPEEEAAAGVVFSTFFIGAYVLARCGEKISHLLLAMAHRRSR
jgi:hypothetical protein